MVFSATTQKCDSVNCSPYLPLAGFALLSAASLAWAEPLAETGAATSGGYIGFGIKAVPRYQGSDESKTRAFPAFEYHWENGVFLGGSDGLVGFEINATRQLQLGIALGLDEGRKESDSRYLKGMGNLDPRGTLNMYAKAAISDQFGLSAGLRMGSGRSGKGSLLNLGANYGVSLAPATHMTFNVDAVLANSDYMRDYFGVSAAQARVSGHKRYTPNSGCRDVTMGIGLQHQISRDWMLFGKFNSTTLSGTAKNSPLVRKATTESAFAGITYSF